MFDAIIVRFDKDTQDKIRGVRNEVFIREQGIDPAIEFDGLDSQALHVLVLANGEPVATGRMLEDGHIGRVAVLSAYRNRGVGSIAVKSLIDEAIARQYPSVYLGAQKSAVEFYLGLGFECYGDEFIEANIPHISMRKSLI